MVSAKPLTHHVLIQNSFQITSLEIIWKNDTLTLMTATQRETVIPKNLQPRPSSFWPPMIGIRKWAATTPHNLQVTKQYAAKQKWHASFFGSKMESLNRKKRINVQWKVLASKMLDMMVWLSKHFLVHGSLIDEMLLVRYTCFSNEPMKATLSSHRETGSSDVSSTPIFSNFLRFF